MFEVYQKFENVLHPMYYTKPITKEMFGVSKESEVTKTVFYLYFEYHPTKAPKVQYMHILYVSILFVYFLRQYPHILANDAQHDLISPLHRVSCQKVNQVSDMILQISSSGPLYQCLAYATFITCFWPMYSVLCTQSLNKLMNFIQLFGTTTKIKSTEKLDQVVLSCIF